MFSKRNILLVFTVNIQLLCFCHGLSPKMLSEQSEAGAPLDTGDDSMTISSSSYQTVGASCSGFTFDVSGGSGFGLIAVGDEGNEITLSFSNADEKGSIKLVDNIGKFSDIFPWGQGENDLIGQAFTFEGIGSEGAQVQVSCSIDTHILIMYSDLSKGVEAEATVNTDGLDEIIVLKNGESESTLHGDVIQNVHSSGRRVLSQRRVLKGDKKTINVGHSTDLKLVHVVKKNKEGVKLHRTLVAPSRKPRKRLNINLRESSINDDGDVTFSLSGLEDTGEVFKVTGRVCLVINSNTYGNCVDVSAMLSNENPNLVVHPGWFRKAIQEANNPESWDIELVEVRVSDPENMYRVVGQMKQGKSKTSRRMLRSESGARKLLSIPPSKEEMEITLEMRTGRKPAQKRTNVRRSLSGTHALLLVHGYCSDFTFQESDFTNYRTFWDPAERRLLGGTFGTNNWSNDEFARKIDEFANNEGLYGCGIVGHSQGGLAALHLYTYYWSCLDDADASSGTKLIQSVGSPYQGTALAGNLAAIGDVFGQGCGTQNDLTHSGATAWLSGIPTWARAELTYFTTSNTDRWWAPDHCNIGSDLILSDPEDGTIQKNKGQVSGATNGGHKTGWCHTPYMRDPGQTLDSQRNSQMNNDARI